jgi:glycosyltransferase 2 family protein
MRRLLPAKKLLRMAFGLLALGVAMYVLDWETLRKTLTKLNPQTFGLIVCLSFCQFVVMSLRWHYLIRSIVSLPLRQHLQYYFYSIFLNTFTPANLGGDVYRLMVLESHVSARTAVITALIQERVLGLLGFCSFYLGCLGAWWILQPRVSLAVSHLFSLAGGVILTGTTGLLFAPFLLARLAVWGHSRLPHGLTNMFRTLITTANLTSCANALGLIGLSLLSVCIWVLTVHAVALDVGLHVSWLMLGMIVVLVELIRLLPISIQGIGVRESAYAYLFGMIGESSESGFIVGAISYLALSLSICLAGVVGMGCLVAPKPPQCS